VLDWAFQNESQRGALFYLGKFNKLLQIIIIVGKWLCLTKVSC